MRAKLVVVGGDAKAAEIQLKLPTIVGRGRNATLTLPHPLVSRQHCEIVESDGQLLVRDLGSMNGTFIGNERISEAVLAPGELLTIGTVTFRAVYDDPIAPPGGNGQAEVETLPEAASQTMASSPAEDDVEEQVQFDSVETEPLRAESAHEGTQPDGDVEPGLFDDLEDDIVHDDSSEDFHLGEALEHSEGAGDSGAVNVEADKAGARELDAVEVAEFDAPEIVDSELDEVDELEEFDELDEVETIDAQKVSDDASPVKGAAANRPSPPTNIGPENTGPENESPASPTAAPTASSVGPTTGPLTPGADPQAPFARSEPAVEGPVQGDNVNNDGDEAGQDADDELKSFLRGLN